MTGWRDRMTVTVPEGELDGLRVKKFEVKPGSVHNFMLGMTGRSTRPGWYTKLTDTRTGTLWMSDTDAERRDHAEAVCAMDFEKASRVLINGLGLGMVLAAALTYDHVTHIDVVEKDERVIKLIGPHYQTDPRVNIIHTDAWDQMKQWPRDRRWDVGWTDIWPEINADNREEYMAMNRFYNRRCNWHGCWAWDMVKREYRRSRAEDRRIAESMN